MTDFSVNPHEQIQQTSSSLLARARLGERAAWERLASLYGPLVYRWCRKWGLQPHDAENVGQETFQAVVRGLADFRREQTGDTFRGWLYRIAQNKFRDYQRAAAPGAIGTGGSDALNQLQNLPQAPPDTLHESQAEDTLLLYRQAVELIRSEFSDTHWQAFFRIVVEGQAPATVARDLQISVNAVYLAKSRILRRVREEYADLLDDMGM